MSGIMNMFVATKTTIATAVDAFFNSVSLLLNTSSTNGAQNNTFLDSSTNNFTITRNGNTSQGTFTPFSQTGWSNYFDGSSYLTTPNNTALNIDTTCSAEVWLYPTVSGADQVILSGNGNWDFLLNNGNVVMRWFYPGYVDTGVTALQLFTWHHIAFSISGGRLSFYVNGTRTYTNASVSITNGSSALTYLGWNGGNNKFYGYLSGARITKGSTPYDPTQTTITVPTAPLTAITNTQLLTCQSNRFADSSTNAFAITPTGTPSVQAFSPFLPTAAYDTAVVGGSGYFDGTGDYLGVGSGTDFNLGTSDFMMEFWYYCTGLGTYAPGIFSKRAGGVATGWAMQSSGFVGLVGGTWYDSWGNPYWVGSTSAAGFNASTSLTKVNQWTHVVMTRSGTDVRWFVNGQMLGYQSRSGSIDQLTGSTLSIGLGGTTSESPYTGYVSNGRIVIGSIPTGYQTSSTTLNAQIFTPPTTPVTTTSQGATSGDVKLLFSVTNAGIYDSASKNVLETVGNAQVSTTQAKWGTTSMYFDGTGDWLLIPNNQMLNLNADFTIEFWIYLNSTSSEQCIFHNHNSDNNGVFVSVNGGGAGKIRLGAGNGSSFYVLIDSSTAISASTWTYVACTRSGSTWTVYINGSSAGTATSSSNPTFSTSDLIQIGRFTSGSPNALNAYIGDLRITKYARTISASPTAAFPLQ